MNDEIDYTIEMVKQDAVTPDGRIHFVTEGVYLEPTFLYIPEPVWQGLGAPTHLMINATPMETPEPEEVSDGGAEG